MPSASACSHFSPAAAQALWLRPMKVLILAVLAEACVLLLGWTTDVIVPSVCNTSQAAVSGIRLKKQNKKLLQQWPNCPVKFTWSKQKKKSHLC